MSSFAPPPLVRSSSGMYIHVYVRTTKQERPRLMLLHMFIAHTTSVNLLVCVQGKISFNNLKRVAKELGENLTDEELQVRDL